MILFNLTPLTQTTPLIQRNVETREIFFMKTLQNFTQSSFII